MKPVITLRKYSKEFSEDNTTNVKSDTPSVLRNRASKL